MHSVPFAVALIVATAVCGAIGALIVADPTATPAEKSIVALVSGIAGLAGVLVLLLAWSLVRAPFEQRNEARAQITPGFPRHELRMRRPWYLDIEVESEADRVVFLPIDFTNREPRQRMSLDFELVSQLRFGDDDWSDGLRICPYTRRRLPDTLEPPLAVEPQTTTTGNLQFTGDDLALDFDTDGIHVFVKRNWRVRLRIIDRVSGGIVEEELPALLTSEKQSAPSESAPAEPHHRP